MSPARPIARPFAQARPEALAKTLSSLLARVTRQAVGQKPAALARLIVDWPLIVGPEFAARTVPKKLSARRADGGATLTLAAAPAEALALQHESARLIERIETYFGQRLVDRIALTQTGAPDRFRAAAGRGWPADTAEPAAETVTAALGPAGAALGEETGTAMRSLARAVLARDGGRG